MRCPLRMCASCGMFFCLVVKPQFSVGEGSRAWPGTQFGLVLLRFSFGNRLELALRLLKGAVKLLALALLCV